MGNLSPVSALRFSLFRVSSAVRSGFYSDLERAIVKLDYWI